MAHTSPAPARSFRGGAAALLVLLSIGCAPTHEQLRRELDRLEMPAGYVFVGEEAGGVYPPFFGDTLRVRRRYRSPYDLGHTCEDLKQMGTDFSTGEISFYPQTQGRVTAVCSVAFRRERFVGGLWAQGPPDPEWARKLGVDPWDYVLVDVQISAP